MKTKIKPKVLLIGWNNQIEKIMLTNELKQLKKKFKIILASEPTLALVEIAKARLLGNKPIHGFVFKRSVLVNHSPKCSVISDLAVFCARKYPVLINMIKNDLDDEAKNNAVGGTFCAEGDWKQVELLLKQALI